MQWSNETIDAAAMRIARAWGIYKEGEDTIPEDAELGDLQDPEFLRALARAALGS